GSNIHQSKASSVRSLSSQPKKANSVSISSHHFIINGNEEDRLRCSFRRCCRQRRGGCRRVYLSRRRPRAEQRRLRSSPRSRCLSCFLCCCLLLELKPPLERERLIYFKFQILCFMFIFL
uniref:Uncharacterized protein n=1 Tax=Cucumis melo TaxID=3656 RepID=A0A9I9DTF2_CUCME